GRDARRRLDGADRQRLAAAHRDDDPVEGPAPPGPLARAGGRNSHEARLGARSSSTPQAGRGPAQETLKIAVRAVNGARRWATLGRDGGDGGLRSRLGQRAGACGCLGPRLRGLQAPPDRPASPDARARGDAAPEVARAPDLLLRPDLL